MGKLRVLCAAMAAAGLVPAAATADLSLSGQVTPAILFGSDVENPEIVDNTGTGSRVRLRGKHGLGSFTVFQRYEIQLQENQSFGAVDGSDSFDVRYAEVGIKGVFGSFSLGKGDGASNATGEISYQTSGNVLGTGHLPYFAVRGVLNRDNPETSVGYVFFDGFSRNSRVRYDTPSFGGLKLSASLTNGERSEFAARFKRGIGPGKLVALAGFANTETGSGDRTMIGIGYKFGFGLSASYGFSSETNATGPDTESFLASVNYQFGKLNVGFDFGESGLDGENEIVQFGAEYKATKQWDIYGGVSDFDNSDGSSLSAAYAGFRYKY